MAPGATCIVSHRTLNTLTRCGNEHRKIAKCSHRDIFNVKTKGFDNLFCIHLFLKPEAINQGLIITHPPIE